MGAGEIGIGELAGVFEAFGRPWNVIQRGQEEGSGRFGYGDRGEAGREGSDVLDGSTF